MSYLEKVNKKHIPKHIAIVMDGNGRWAKLHGHERIYGHQHGVTPVRESAEAAAELGVSYLTLYTFSTENWNRPKEEVNALMELLVSTIHSEIGTLNKNNIRLRTIGATDQLPTKCREELKEAKLSTAKNDHLDLILALNYSSRWEIINAIQQIAHKVKSGDLLPENIDEALFEKSLTTEGIPDPELMIRTSGEQRISNFLLWQLSYSELYFTDTLWPDFRKEDFYKAIVEFQGRERRFGKTSEQLAE